MRLAHILSSSFAFSLPSFCAAQLAIAASFNPAEAGGFCGGSHDHASGSLWVYDCSAATVQRFSEAGALLGSVPRPGESANDVDVAIAPEGLILGTSPVPAGTPLFINGESGVAEIYALDPSSGAVLATLVTAFGASHVVGGSYHPERGTFFLVQDNVPSASLDNLVAEVSAADGSVLGTFSTIDAGFNVSFGDLEVSPANGNLFVVSSIETTIAEFTPEGVLVTEHALPVGVTAPAGIGLASNDGTGWIFGNGGTIWKLTGFPEANCPADTNNDGQVTPADFGAWITAFNTQAPECDQNGDALCTPADFGAWITNFNAGC